MDAGFFCPEHEIHIFEHSRIGLTKRCVKNCKKTVFLPHEPAGERAEKLLPFPVRRSSDIYFGEKGSFASFAAALIRRKEEFWF